MPTIQEGNLIFDFPAADSWFAFKYDEDTPPGYYRQRIDRIDGLKGVDIIAGQRPAFDTLTLIEIKDFRLDSKGLKEKVESGEIPLEILQKALNTCSALYLGARAHDALLDAGLRAAVLRPCSEIRLVFFLQEAPLPYSPIISDRLKKEHNHRVKRQLMEKKMREKLKPLGIDCRLAELGQLPRGCGWTVTEAS
ncbi:hypothetical protein [Hymenobacter sublimis]|uniref:Uncharacterized protein n=1 Tax=Hymenobacter sublimis TaxID=2933777 RepID=A0ABY4JE56_9BACT|nr:hypothetical protein [Hymenobacter sublimis]UPL50224.1 hypothetical protein MWH26_04775 [Hymenobacter sublimis]